MRLNSSKKEVDMSEREKIIELIKSHQAVFDSTDMDIVESPKGHWLFTRYNESYGYYDAIVHFETAKELAEILLGELAIDIFVDIDREEEAEEGYINYADDVSSSNSYKPNIERLLEYLGK